MALREQARLRLALFFFRSALRGHALFGDPAAAVLNRSPNTSPYRLYERVRERGELSRSSLGMYTTASHSVVNSILRDHRFGVRTADNNSRETFQPAGVARGQDVHPIQDSFLSLDPPAHTRLRKMAAPWFTPRALRAQTERIESVVESFLDELAGRDEFDLIDDFAVRVPIQVICDLLGVPGQEYERFIPWGAILGASLDDVRTMAEHRRLRGALGEMAEFFDGLIALRREQPGDDLVSELVRAGAEDPEVLHTDLVASTEILLVAGFETTVNLIGNAVLALLRNPDALAWFIANPDRADDLVEEVLRHDPPVQLTMRLAHEPVTIAGVDLRRDDVVLMLLAGASRDPSVFTAPERFDPTRPNNRDHLAFSAGVHYCIGAGLARIEAAVALRALFLRYPKLAQAGPERRRHSRNINGMLHLPVRGNTVRRSVLT
ncbi:MAG TPA: cytochrome P450 [Pseudonocardiaceae bacterium]|nr:cytochrome P450 [Pseudonocardiaceae bacterium]